MKRPNGVANSVVSLLLVHDFHVPPSGAAEAMELHLASAIAVPPRFAEKSVEVTNTYLRGDKHAPAASQVPISGRWQSLP